MDCMVLKEEIPNESRDNEMRETSFQCSVQCQKTMSSIKPQNEKSKKLLQKCGEVFICEDDLFSFLCTLCEVPFDEITHFFTHVKGEHVDKTHSFENQKQNIKIETPLQCSLNDEMEPFSNNTLNPPIENNLTNKNHKNCDDYAEDDNTVLSKLFKINKSHSRSNEEETKTVLTTETSISSELDKCSKKTRVVCDICHKDFASKKGVRRHKIYKHSNSITIPKSFKCNYCDRYFEDSSKRNDHERFHTDERPYQCQICGKCFRTRAVFRAHERTHSSEREFKCELCDLAFKNKSTLYAHNQRHGEKKFPCSHCDKSFFQKAEREEHERIHTGEKPYQCNFCGKCFAAYSGFNRHSKSHLDIRPHKCQHCDRSFFTKAHLNNHIVVHTGERPFTCSACNATFPRQKALKSHEKIHSDVRGYICKICGKGFKQCTVLNSHMKSHRRAMNLDKA